MGGGSRVPFFCLLQQTVNGHIESRRQPEDHCQRGISFPAFDSADVGAVDSGVVRQKLLRKALRRAKFTYRSAEGKALVVLGLHAYEINRMLLDSLQTMSII